VAHPTRRANDPQPLTPWFSLRSLRGKLQLFSLLLVLVPGALIALITLDRARDALGRATGRQLAEVAHDALEEIATVLADARASVRGWARQDVMRDVLVGDVDKRVTRFFLALQHEASPYRALVCTDRTGRVVAATDPSEIGGMLADQAWVRAALAGEEFLAGPGPLDDGSDQTVEIAVPIRDVAGSGAPIGALLARYDWGDAMSVADRIRRTLVPHGLTVDLLLLDRHGTMLGATWHDGIDARERDLRRAAGQRLAGQIPAERVRGFLSPEDAAVLVGYERGDYLKFDWLALVMEPLDEAFRPIREMEHRLVLGLAAVLLGALGVATYLAGRMTRPLRELTQAAAEIAHGRSPHARVVARSRDEIGQLAATFNGMAAELQRAQEDLLTAAKFAFVGEVAAGVAHEVRTPLGILRSSAQMLERSVPKDQPQTVELASMMIEEVDRLDRVVDGLLELARPHEPLVEPTSLQTVLERALEFVEAQAREKRIALVREFGAGPGMAQCDPEQIYQVALNLIVNALQILPAGGHIAVRTLPRRGNRVGFEVSDDGPGIAPEVRDRIFTPFFSLRAGGTGLGLALVQRVAHEHQGTVSVDSTVGRGTTFRVELPAAEAGA